MSNFYWVAMSDSSFSAPYWATSSGGAPGIAVPGLSDFAVFDGGSGGDCTVDSGVAINNLKLDQGFGYNLVQSNYPITTSDASFLGGGFVGSSQPVTVNGNLTLSGSFTWFGTDSTFYALNDVYCLTGFSPKNATCLCFQGVNEQGLHCDGGTLPSMQVDKTSSNQIKVYGNSSIYIKGDFLLHDGTFNTNRHGIVQSS